MIHANGSTKWYRDGVRHREGAPACEYVNGTEKWYLNGLRHREDGPAAIYPDGRELWFIEGVRVDPQPRTEREGAGGLATRWSGVGTLQRPAPEVRAPVARPEEGQISSSRRRMPRPEGMDEAGRPGDPAVTHKERKTRPVAAAAMPALCVAFALRSFAGHLRELPAAGFSGFFLSPGRKAKLPVASVPV